MFNQFKGKSIALTWNTIVIALPIRTVIAVICSADRNKHKDAVKVEYDDDGEVLPSARAWFLGKVLNPTYNDVESFLYFLDKYTRIIVGGSKAMAEYMKLNKGKTLIDRVTVSDIAYSMLVYGVWEFIQCLDGGDIQGGNVHNKGREESI